MKMMQYATYSHTNVSYITIMWRHETMGANVWVVSILMIEGMGVNVCILQGVCMGEVDTLAKVSPVSVETSLSFMSSRSCLFPINIRPVGIWSTFSCRETGFIRAGSLNCVLHKYFALLIQQWSTSNPGRDGTEVWCSYFRVELHARTVFRGKN